MNLGKISEALQQRPLAQRVLTGAALIALALFVFAIGGRLLVFTALILCALSIYEYYHFALNERTESVLQHSAAVFLLPLGYLYASFSGLLAGALIALVILFLLQIFSIESTVNEPVFQERVPAALGGLVYPGLLASSLVVLAAQPGARLYLAWLIAVVACSDTGAFFGGRAIGGAKLAPRISPGKTQAGAYSGFAAALVGALLFDRLLGLPMNFWQTMFFGSIVAILAQLGDLAESLIKRVYHAKDSSHLLPGHGGVLDRIDALMFAAPVLFFVPL